MRVTAEAKRATRRRILDAAGRLFGGGRFEGVTTREIAREAGIANGTLFNYFATKEAIAGALVAGALGEARGRFDRQAARSGSGSLEEDLFALVAEELRGLRPHRGYLAIALAHASKGPAGAEAEGEGDGLEAIRAGHMALVARFLASRGHLVPPTFVTEHLYWTLYTGVLAFWADDPSPCQEDTLAVLDQSLRAFVGALPAGRPGGPSA